MGGRVNPVGEMSDRKNLRQAGQMRRRMVVAKTQMDQQQRIVADETKPQVAVKGGRFAP